MKNILTILSISCLLSVINLLSCSSTDNSSLKDKDPGTKFVTGEIVMVGNEPFTRLALADDDSLYLMDCPDEIEEILYSNQGKTAKIFFSSTSTNKESFKVLKVEKVEILN
jgi:hypothetical protein